MRANNTGGWIIETADELIDCLARGDEIKRVSTDLLVAAVEKLDEIWRMEDVPGADDGSTMPAAEYGRRGRLIHKCAGLLSLVETDGTAEALEAVRELRQLVCATEDRCLAYSLLVMRETLTAQQHELLNQMGWTR